MPPAATLEMTGAVVSVSTSRRMFEIVRMNLWQFALADPSSPLIATSAYNQIPDSDLRDRSVGRKYIMFIEPQLLGDNVPSAFSWATQKNL